MNFVNHGHHKVRLFEDLKNKPLDVAKLIFNHPAFDVQYALLEYYKANTSLVYGFRSDQVKTWEELDILCKLNPQKIMTFWVYLKYNQKDVHGVISFLKNKTEWVVEKEDKDSFSKDLDGLLRA